MGDDGTSGRAYGHALVVGLSKYPKKVKKNDSKEKQAKAKRSKCFIKMVNYNHLMPTRYTLDVDLKRGHPGRARQRHQEGGGAEEGQEADGGALRDGQEPLVLPAPALLDALCKVRLFGQ